IWVVFRRFGEDADKMICCIAALWQGITQLGEVLNGIGNGAVKGDSARRKQNDPIKHFEQVPGRLMDCAHYSHALPGNVADVADDVEGAVGVETRSGLVKEKTAKSFSTASG